MLLFRTLSDVKKKETFFFFYLSRSDVLQQLGTAADVQFVWLLTMNLRIKNISPLFLFTMEPSDRTLLSDH